jgi:hypothetical protein
MGEKKNACRILMGKPERIHLKDTGVDGRVILKQILQTQYGRV